MTSWQRVLEMAAYFLLERPPSAGMYPLSYLYLSILSVVSLDVIIMSLPI